MLFNEKFGISHINYNSGRICIDYSADEQLSSPEDNLWGLIEGFSRLCGGIRESTGYASYSVSNSPYEILFSLTNNEGIVITVEDMRKIDDIVKYVKDSIADINYNMLYLSGFNE